MSQANAHPNDRNGAGDPAVAHSWADLAALCEAALQKAGANAQTAAAMSAATVDAERRGNSPVGVSHLFDYIEALNSGRLNGTPSPLVEAPLPAIISVNADRGSAQLAYLTARAQLLEAAATCGIAMLGISKSFTSGELGYFSADVAEHGCVALAGTNSPALMSAFRATIPVTGTNPFSFAFPGDPRPRVIDQSSSEAAWVRIRDAAARGEEIPLGWAIDEAGQPTTNAQDALAGAVVPFGGVKGANIAMMVELLAALAGGKFSWDSSNDQGDGESPEIGVWVIAINPEAFGAGYIDRVDTHFDRLSAFIGHDFGRRRAPLREPNVDAVHIERLQAYISGLPESE